VTLRLGAEVTADTVAVERPDAVIVATGQEESRPNHIPGMDGPRVRTPLQILAGTRPAPGHVLILDEIGAHQATTLAEYLIEGGCRVTLVTSAFTVGQQLGVTLDLELWHSRMAGKAITVLTGHIVLDVTGDPLLMDIYSSAQRPLPGVDLIVPVNHGRPRHQLYFDLQGRVPILLRVGDALAPKDVGEAILDGHRAARLLNPDVLTAPVVWQ
jgi:2,4-dienoyl-CoA reductase (NADPH2)